jgi:hypothetical protein
VTEDLVGLALLGVEGVPEPLGLLARQPGTRLRHLGRVGHIRIERVAARTLVYQ